MIGVFLGSRPGRRIMAILAAHLAEMRIVALRAGHPHVNRIGRHLLDNFEAVAALVTVAPQLLGGFDGRMAKRWFQKEIVT
jgi:hypothetical protein